MPAIEPPILRDGEITLRAPRPDDADTGERRKAPRNADPEPVYAVYAWEA